MKAWSIANIGYMGVQTLEGICMCMTSNYWFADDYIEWEISVHAIESESH